MQIAYHPSYNIGFFGIERFHPFDSKKYGRAWERLSTEFGEQLLHAQIKVPAAVSRSDLLLVHGADYIESLNSSAVVSQAIELPIIGYLPLPIVKRQVLRPMRLAVQGSVLAASSALHCGLAVNLSGGYHHAKPDKGEGFCIYSDIALCVAKLRQDGQLQAASRIAYIDVDAHQGNGVCYHFKHDPTVFIFDMYNASNYPASDDYAQARINHNLPLEPGTSGDTYLQTLAGELPKFLASFADSPPALAIYNAGTDVFIEDDLGGLRLKADDVLSRDLLAINELRQRNIPVVMLLSGGYSAKSYELVANTLSALFKKYGFSAC